MTFLYDTQGVSSAFGVIKALTVLTYIHVNRSLFYTVHCLSERSHQHPTGWEEDEEENKASKCKPCMRHKTEYCMTVLGKKGTSFPLINSGADNIPSSHCLKENSNKRSFNFRSTWQHKDSSYLWLIQYIQYFFNTVKLVLVSLLIWQ